MWYDPERRAFAGKVTILIVSSLEIILATYTRLPLRFDFLLEAGNGVIFQKGSERETSEPIDGLFIAIFFVSLYRLDRYKSRATYSLRSREANTLNEIMTDSHSLFDFEFAGRLRVAYKLYS